MPYLRTRICEIPAPEIVAMCDDLLEAANYDNQSCYDLRLYDWLVWFFHEQAHSRLTNQHFLPQSALVRKIHTLAGNPLYSFCRELASLQRLHFEAYEQKNLLTFLKGVFRDVLNAFQREEKKRRSRS